MVIPKKCRFLCSLVLATGVAGCASGSAQVGKGSSNNCDTIGQVVGGALGAVGGYFGSRAAGGNTAVRVLATVGGTAAGAWLGGEFACYLTTDDQEKMVEATQETAVSGEKTTWSNPETGASGTAEVVKTEDTQKEASIPVLKDRVKKVPPLDLIGQPYQATIEANVRGGPGSDYVVVDILNKGETVTVAGKVRGQPWYMINQNGVGAGFVQADLLASIPAPAPSRPAAQQASPPPEAAVDTQTVAVSTTCRTVRQTIVLKDGKSHEEDITVCKGPNGWVPA